MSRVGAELVNTLMDEVLSEGTVDLWDKAKDKTLRLIDTITFHRGTGAKLEQFLKSKIIAPAKRWGMREIPVPQMIRRRAKESTQSRARRMVANAALYSVNHPVPRFLLTAGLIAGVTVGVGFSPTVIPTVLAAAYAIKISSAYIFMGLKWGYKKWRHRKTPKSKTETARKLSVREKYRAAVNSLCEVAFNKGQKNPYLNILDIVMTVTSGVLLIPTCAQLNGWIARAWNVPQKAAAEGIAQSAGLTQMGEAAESGIARQMGGETMRQTGRQLAVRAAQQEGAAISQSVLSRLATVASAIPERGFGVVGQGTIKYFGGGLARKYAPELADEAAIGVVAMAATAGFARMVPLKLRDAYVRFSNALKKDTAPPPSWAMSGFCRVM